MPTGVELSAYRIVQEAVTNAARHAGASEVVVTLTFGERFIDVEVEDDGAGPGAADRSGHGLIGMRERVALLGGELRVGPGAAGGFRVAAHLPTGAAA